MRVLTVYQNSTSNISNSKSLLTDMFWENIRELSLKLKFKNEVVGDELFDMVEVDLNVLHYWHIPM